MVYTLAKEHCPPSVAEKLRQLVYKKEIITSKIEPQVTKDELKLLNMAMDVWMNETYPPTPEDRNLAIKIKEMIDA
jgi:hypothetical protein